MKLVTIACLFVAGIIIASCGEIGPMLVLVSQMEGTLVDKDLRPVSNVRVERSWEWGWNGKKGSDVSTTDAQGHFQFRKVTGFSLTAILPHQPQIEISITAQGPSGPVALYERTKSDYDDNSEMGGKPLNIVCRIDLEPALQLGRYWGTVIEVK